MTMLIKGGSTSRRVLLAVYSTTTGLPYTTAAYNDAGIAVKYQRAPNGTITSITPVTQTATGAWTSGGFVALADNIVRLDVPDAAFATGADSVLITASATAWVAVAVEVQLVGYDPRTDAVATVAGMLDSNVVDWKGATAVAMTGDAYARIGAAGAGLTAVGDTRLANLDATVSSRSTLTVAQVWDRLTSALTTTGSIGKLIVDYLDAAVSSRLSSATASVTITGPVLTSGDIVIVQGDDYSATDGRSLDWTYTDATADYTSSTAQIVLDKSGTTKTFTMNAPSKSGSTVTLRWVPSATDTADTNLSAGVWTFQIHVTLSSGRKLTPVRGSAAVIDRIA